MPEENNEKEKKRQKLSIKVLMFPHFFVYIESQKKHHFVRVCK